MNNNILKKQGVILVLLISIITGLLSSGCNKKEEETEDCIARTKRDQYFGYEIWAGDSALFANNPSTSYTYYYNIDKYYTLIGKGTTTNSFNTGTYKYFVLVARWYCCIDAIQFANGSYITQGQGEPYTLITGLAEFPPGSTPPNPTAFRYLGSPDGINANLGYKDLCKEPNSFGGFITITTPIIQLGGGLTVFVANDGCN